MPWSPEHKQQTRERILDSAARLFALNGYDKVGINDVMADAGLTRGAFYAHFSSKTQLYAEAIVTSALQGRAMLHPDENQPPQLEALINGYLSLEHRQGEQVRCPLAFLTTDISQREEQVRDTYTRVFKGFVNALQQHLNPEDAASEQQALRTAVVMIGGMAIARAINDEELAGSLLEVCREAALVGASSNA